MTTEPPFRQSRIPHWGWWLKRAVAIILMVGAGSVVLPVYRHYRTVSALKTKGCTVRFHKTGRFLGLFKPIESWGLISSVESINASNKPVTDDDLQYLGVMSGLKTVVLSGTQVTDSGLAHLTGLSKLQRLDLKATKVSPSGIATLKAALPKTTIEGPSISSKGNRR